jgi:photosystem II stability/assembly factor-like uncharacterized protein
VGELVQIVDVSPRRATTDIRDILQFQSVSGKAYCITCSPDGARVYVGGASGVWRSDDGGQTWRHLELPQPPPGVTVVEGALLVPNVYDLLVSPTNPDLVLAGTGPDIRSPSQAGVYRSVDGGQTWTLVFQVANSQGVGRLAMAPDDPQLVYASGGFALGISTDGGATWKTVGANSSSWAQHVVAGPTEGQARWVYAVGERVSVSMDGGETWTQDAVTGLSLGFPDDHSGESSRALCIHPADPRIVYLTQGTVTVWRGDFTTFATTKSATWVELPTPPIGFANTTASGCSYVHVHRSPSGTLYFVVSDARAVQVAAGEPATVADYVRVDTANVHVDPHGLSITPDFRFSVLGDPGPPSGKMFMVNDGGAVVSTDGAKTWSLPDGLTSLGLVNAAAIPVPGGTPGICIGCGDNSGFFSTDDGAHWKTQDYEGGDNDCCFVDPRQPWRLLVFVPRSGSRGIALYRCPPGQIPDGSIGTSEKIEIVGPVAPPGGGPAWCSGSGDFNSGYRPLVLGTSDESPLDDGDFITIVYRGGAASLIRTLTLSQIASAGDWLSTASAPGPGVKAFQVGPDLPVPSANVAQASGGHANTVFYVGDIGPTGGVWRWTAGMTAWKAIVPGPPVADAPTPSRANRFFVDPYRPSTVYVLAPDHLYRSDDGGGTWAVDASLETALTAGGAIPVVVPDDRMPGEALVRDILFDPARPGYRFAIGPAGVFYTLDGVHWDHLLLTSANPMRPNNAYYDDVSDPCGRALYVSTNARGLLKIAPLPPEWDFPVGAIEAADGRITFLRVHDVGTGWGPPEDFLDVEVVVQLDSQPGKSFGFQLRADDEVTVRRGMLELLRETFRADASVRIEFTRVGCRTGRILRVLRLT